MRAPLAKVMFPETVLSPPMLRSAPEPPPSPLSVIASAIVIDVALDNSSNAPALTAVVPFVLPKAFALITRKAPVETVSPPLKLLLLPPNKSVLLPALVKVPVPVIGPLNSALAPTVVVKLPAPREILPLPETAPTLSVKPLTSKVAPLAMLMADCEEIRLSAPSRSVPALIVVVPVYPLFPESSSTPAPVLVRLPVLLIAPLMLTWSVELVPASTVKLPSKKISLLKVLVPEPDSPMVRRALLVLGAT